MHIDYDILIAYGGFARKFEKGDIIFHEGSDPYFFYQVVTGEVKLYLSNPEGKELIQGTFKAGESFGEPPLLLGRKYPTTAQAMIPCIIVKINLVRLLCIMKDYPELTNRLLYCFAERIYNKVNTAQILISQTPEEKIILFLNKLKEADKNGRRKLVPYTRQQIADCTGLRVETVIRTLVRMNKEKKVNIVDRKVYY